MSTSLNAGIELLDEVMTDAGQYLSANVYDQANATRQRLQERRGYDPEVTVVAVSGPTGAGKSSVINALIGNDLLTVAPTRPTTAHPTALSSLPQSEQKNIMQWLDVTHSYECSELSQIFGTSAPFILIDLPDIDSTSVSNRQTAASIITRADVIVWVVDPQKYADSIVHDEYLKGMAEHSSVMITVLNQADRLSPDDLDRVVGSLRGILTSHNVSSDLLVTSAVTGAGIDNLRSRISLLIDAKKAMLDKLAADLRTVGTAIGEDLEVTGAKQRKAQAPNPQHFVDSVLNAAGAPVVARLASQSYEYRAKKATRWPVTRWITALKIDPLQRFRLAGGPAEPENNPVTGIALSEVALQQADNEYQRYVTQATSHLPRRWAQEIISDTHHSVETLVRRVDYVSSHAELETRRHPLWWRLVNVMQWLLMITVFGGVLWLVAHALAVNLGIWLDRPPMVGIFPLPLVMVIGGVMLGWLISFISRIVIRRGRNRTYHRVHRRLLAAFREDLIEHLLEPLEKHIAVYNRVAQACIELAKVQQP